MKLRATTVLRRFLDGAGIVDLECEFDIDRDYVERCIRRGLRGEVRVQATATKRRRADNALEALRLVRPDTERRIFAASYAIAFDRLIQAGYPHAWRVADQEAGRAPGEGIASWEEWCAATAITHAEGSVSLYRKARR